MPNAKQKLNALMAEGLSVYPPGLRGVPRALSTSQTNIAGLGQRPAFITGRRTGEPVVLTARQTAWGAGRSSRRPSPAERERNRQRFVQWLKKNEPRLYAIAKSRAGTPPTDLAGLGQEPSKSWFEKFTDSISNLAPTYLQYKTQKDLLAIQLDRASQGLPPLETSQYAPAVQVGLDPEQTRAAIAAAGGQAGAFLTSPPVLLGGAALLLFVMMKK